MKREKAVQPRSSVTTYQAGDIILPHVWFVHNQLVIYFFGFSGTIYIVKNLFYGVLSLHLRTEFILLFWVYFEQPFAMY